MHKQLVIFPKCMRRFKKCRNKIIDIYIRHNINEFNAVDGYLRQIRHRNEFNDT